jgi:lysozyme family protein
LTSCRRASPWPPSTCGVNGGHANLWLQKAYNETGGDPKLDEDGSLGPKSIAALRLASESAILKAFIDLRDARFRALANKGLGKFLDGWLARDADLRKFLGV